MAFPAIESQIPTGSTATGGAASGGGIAAAFHLVDLPATVSAGSLLVVIGRVAVAGTVAVTGGGWTIIQDSSDATDDVSFWMVRDTLAAGTEDGTQITVTHGTGKMAAYSFSITGAEDPASLPPAMSTIAVGTTTTPNPDAATPPLGAMDYLWLAVYLMDGEAILNKTPPTNYTERFDVTTGTGGATTDNAQVTVCDRQLNAASEDPGQITLSATPAGWTAWTLAIYPAGAAPTVVTAASALAATGTIETAGIAETPTPVGGPTFLRVRELPPLRLSHDIQTPSGKHYRWAEDEPLPANIPSGVRFGDTMPGGFENSEAVLPRKPGIAYSDLERLSTWTIYGAGGETAWQGRLERAPRTSGDQMAVSPSAVGWQAHLEDDKSARMVYVDRDLGRWGDPPLTHRLSTILVPRTQGKMSVTNGDGGISWEVPNEALPAAEVSILQYDIGVGMEAVRLEYRGDRDGAFTSFEAATVYSSDTENFASSSSEALTLDNTTRIATGFTDGRYLMLRLLTTGAVTPAAGHQQRYELLAVYGDHGMPVAAVAGDASGMLASWVVAHAVSRWAPGLVVSAGGAGASVETSTFVIPHLVFAEPTTAGEIVRQASRFGLEDWAVWDNKEFVWAPRNANARSWRARIGPSQLSETGSSVERLWNSIIVQYQDVDGSARTVGPPGSGADTESDDLVDDDPENPANQLGINRRDLLTTGTSTPEAAITLGHRFLQETRLLDRSGQARFVGHVEDAHGCTCPYWMPRAGDNVVFVDSNDTGPRRIVKTDKDHASRTCSVDLDAPPQGIQAILERLNVVLVPLGL